MHVQLEKREIMKRALALVSFSELPWSVATLVDRLLQEASVKNMAQVARDAILS